MAEDFGKREDGSKKGRGFLGVHKRVNDDKVSSEISVGLNLDGKETELPTMVPTLDPSEVVELLELKDGDRISDSIIKKSAEHARERIKQGKSTFASDEESPDYSKGVDKGEIGKKWSDTFEE